MGVPLEHSSLPPEPTSGIFRKAQSRPEPVGPDPLVLAAHACDAACSDRALVLVEEDRSRKALSVVLSAANIRMEPGTELLGWLSRAIDAGPMPVPPRARRAAGSSHVLAVPLQTPITRVGVLAVPATPEWGNLLAELESLGADYALQVEIAERRAQLRALRAATRSRRPA